MDLDHLALRLRPATGSKRANPSWDAGDRAAKIQRTLSYEGNANANNLDNGSRRSLYEQFDLPQNNVCRDYEHQYGHGPGSHSENFTLSEFANPSLNSIPKTYQMPTNNFYPSLDEVDIPMGNTPIYANQYPISALEETLPRMDFNNGNDFFQGPSDRYTTAPLNSPFEVNPSQHGPSISGAFQISNAQSEPPQALDLEESPDISNNYDTCFGVVCILCAVFQTFL